MSLYGTNLDDYLIAGEGQRFVHDLNGDDVLVANSNGSLFYGDGDDDQLHSGASADVMDGEHGIDEANYNYSIGGVTINLLTGIGHSGWAEGDQLYGIEDVTDSFFDDVLIGNGADNILNGVSGSDLIQAGAGNDIEISPFFV